MNNRANQRRTSGELCDRDVTLLQMLIDEYQGNLPTSMRYKKSVLLRTGDVELYGSTNRWWSRICGNVSLISFWDVCKALKESMVSDREISDNQRKPLNNYLMEAFNSEDRSLLIRRMFSVTLAIGDAKNNQNNNGDNKQNPEKNKDNQNKNNENNKQNPPKKDQQKDGAGNVYLFAVPGITRPHSMGGGKGSLLIPTNAPRQSDDVEVIQVTRRYDIEE